MRFVEESEGSFSAAVLAAAERELEEQKKEWELDRLRALREEEERRMRLADDDEEKPLTFSREDAQNQVNSAAINRGGTKRLVNKRLPSRRSLRRRGSGGRRGRARESSSRSESETTSTESESESESQEEDMIEDSLDEESSHTESQSQGDEGEGEEEGDKGEEREEASEGNEDGKANNNGTERGGFSRRKSRLSGGSCSRNHFDLNSPRTRSRGNVQINLWTLDVSPILPGVKPNCRGRRRKKFHRAKSEETSILPQSSVVVTNLKRGTRVNMSVKASVSSDQNTKTDFIKLTEENRDLSKNDQSSAKKDQNFMSSVDSNKIEQRVIDSDTEQSINDHVDSTISITKTHSSQTKMSDNVERNEEREKIANGTNFITTACSVQMTRCSQKPSSMVSRKLGSEVNRKEDAENLDVNVSTTDSRTSSIILSETAPLKHTKETPIKSISEFLAAANSTCNSARGKTNIAVSKEPEKSIESSSNRSTPLLRSKTLLSNSPDTLNDKNAKSVATSRAFVTQRNSKSNVIDDIPSTNDKEKARDNDVNDDALIVEPPIRKYASQKLSNSKNDARENSDLDLVEKIDDSESNLVCDSSVNSAKNETNLNEPKHKIRKVLVDNAAVISRGIMTRSSKVPSITHDNGSEESSVKLTNDKVDSVSEVTTKSGIQQLKVNQYARKSDVSSQQLQSVITEQSRVTRSTALMGGSVTSSPVIGDTSSLSLRLKRRPDTPLPRPVTRSASSVNPVSVTTIDGACRGEKHATRNLKVSSYQDNCFASPMPLKRDSPIPLMKSDLGKETAIVVIERTNVHVKHRPDTPRPTFPPNNEQVSRVTRSSLMQNFTTRASPSPSSSVAVSSMIRTSSRQQRGSPTNSESSSNESAEQQRVTSVLSEKPQRTAKVVAILTLDTRSNHCNNHYNKALSSTQPKSNCGAGLETKVHDKELMARLSDSLKEQDNEDYDSSSDSKSKRLRRETKRTKIISHTVVENEDGHDEVDESRLRKVACSSPSLSTATATSTQTSRSEKLRSTTIS